MAEKLNNNEPFNAWSDRFLAEFDARRANQLKQKWALAFNDRGLGHGDYGIVAQNNDELIIGGLTQELALHLIELHNKSLGTA